MTKKPNKYIRNTMNSTGMMTAELIGIKTTGAIAGTITGPGAAIAGSAIGTGFALAGTASLANTAFGKGGVMDSMKSLDYSPKRRKRR